MNRTKSEAVYSIKRFIRPSQQLRTLGNSTFQQNRSLMERDFLESSSNDGVVDTRSRFEEIFLSSPRAQELYSSAGPVHQKAVTAKSFHSFDNVFKMAESFHNKSSTFTSLHSSLSDQSLVKSKTPVSSLRDKEFEVSPFKPFVNDSAIKKKVSLVISRLEDVEDTTPIPNKTTGKKMQHVEVGISKDSGFNDVQSDSAGSNEGTFTNIINRDTRVPPGSIERQSAKSNGVTTIAQAQTADGGEEVHISFDENDQEVDVVSEDIQVDNENDEKTGGEDDNNYVDKNNNLSTKTTDKTVSESLNSSTELGPKKQQKSSRLNVLKLWSIKAVKTRTHMGIIVEGQRSEDPVGELWHSTAIVSRVNARLVQTKSGSQYRLVGPVNETVTLQQGFSPKFVESFKNGFPSNWLLLVSDHFNSQSSSESEDENPIPDQPVKKDKRPTSKTIRHSNLTATPPESRVKVKGKVSTALQTPKDRSLPREVEVKTTRSGRMVKPPLAWWRGQRIITDRYHNLEGITSGGEDHTPISPMYNIDVKLPVKGEKSSPLKQRHFLSDDEHRKVGSRSHRKEPQQTESSEESVIPPQQKISGPKQPTGAENSRKDRTTLRSPYKAIGTDKSQQMSTDHNKGDSREAAVERGRNSSQSGKLTDDVGEQNASYAFEESNSSDGSSDRDIVQNLKKELFNSPEKSLGKSQNLQVQSEAKEMNGKDKKSHESRIEGGTPKKKRYYVGRRSPRKAAEPTASEYNLPNNASIPKKNTSAGTVTEKSRNKQERKNPATGRVNFEVENVEQLPLAKIPSPAKRVLRSHGNKANSFKNVVISDADSEDGTRMRGKVKRARARASLKTSESETRASSCGEESDSTRDSGKGSKAASKKGNVQKKVFHGRVQALVNEATTQSSEEDSDEMSRKPLKKPQAPPKLAKTITVMQRESGKKGSGKTQASKVSKNAKDGKKQQNVLFDETPWEDEEIERLNEALYTIPGNTPMFWQKISRKVRSRTARECQLRHQGHVLVSNKKETSARKISAKEKNVPGVEGPPQQNVKTVSGGVGTIKRKREIRELLEQQDVNYEDDIFDATPFKKKKDLKLPFNLNSNSSDEAGDDDDDDDDDEEEESESERGMSYKTPSSRTPSSRFRPLGPLSTTTTPNSEFISPSLLHQVNRKDMDHYIYRMQQGKRGTQAHGKPKAKMRTSTPKKAASSSSHLSMINSELFEAHPASDHDSAEGDDDYYFSDE